MVKNLSWFVFKPRDKDEVKVAISDLDDVTQKIQEIRNRLRERIAKFSSEANIDIEAFETSAKALFEGIFEYAKENRYDLLDVGEKSVKFSTGTISWRNTLTHEEFVVRLIDGMEIIKVIKKLAVRKPKPKSKLKPKKKKKKKK